MSIHIRPPSPELAIDRTVIAKLVKLLEVGDIVGAAALSMGVKQ